MLIRVQAHKNDPTSPFNINGMIALNGFIQRGHYAEFFRLEDIDSTPFRREEPVIGGVGTYRLIFEKLGVTWARSSYPTALLPYLGREVGLIKLHDLPALLQKRMVFIKPANDDKRFTGFLCKHEDDRWNPKLSAMEPDAILAWADPVNFLAEFRVYVLNGHIQNISRYRGKVDFHPNTVLIRRMIADFTNAPIAYGLDVGVLDDGRTVLVETNEALALGNYGLPSMLHAKMIASRWFELMGDRTSMTSEADAVDSPSYLNQF